MPDIPLLSELQTESLTGIYERWYDIVQYCTMTDLTYPEKDKLVAMAAIARRFDHLLPDRYYAGIFETDLHFGLLCTPVRHYKGTSQLKRLEWSLTITIDQDRSHRYQAPIWSWASVNDRISLPPRQKRGNWRTMTDIKSVSISPKDPQNLFGQIVSAELTMAGNLVGLNEMIEDWTLYPYDSQGRNFEPHSSDETLYAVSILETVYPGDCVSRTRRGHCASSLSAERCYCRSRPPKCFREV